MNQNAIAQAMIRQIVAHAKCSVCGHRFAKNDVQVIGQRDNAWAMSVTCRECRTKGLMLAVMQNGATQPYHTDLEPSEWARVKEREPISVDDVVDIYEYLTAYNGDFSEILDEPLEDE